MYSSLLLVAVLAAEVAPAPEAAPPLVVPAELTAPIPVPPPPSPAGPTTYRVLLGGRLVGEFSGPARLELPLGRYQIEWGSRSVEVDLKGGPSVLVDEVGLVLGTRSPLASPAVEPLGWDLTLPAGRSRLQIAFLGDYWNERGTGLRTRFGYTTSGTVGVTDRLLLNVPSPALLYRFGGREVLEVSPWLGMTGFVFGDSFLDGKRFDYQLGVGVVVRKWTSDRDILAFSLDVGSVGMESEKGRISPEDWHLAVALGYTRHLGTAATLNLGARLTSVFVEDGTGGFQSPVVVLGAAQKWGFVPAPLLQLHLTRRISLDASYTFTLGPDNWTEHTFAGGMTAVF